MNEKELDIGYKWCLHCERTYGIEECRHINDLDMCPYEDCDGDVVWDGLSWEDIRRYHPEYPEVPVKGVKYPQ
jgi:hypothetical protein